MNIFMPNIKSPRLLWSLPYLPIDRNLQKFALCPKNEETKKVDDDFICIISLMHSLSTSYSTSIICCLILKTFNTVFIITTTMTGFWIFFAVRPSESNSIPNIVHSEIKASGNKINDIY